MAPDLANEVTSTVAIPRRLPPNTRPQPDGTYRVRVQVGGHRLDRRAGRPSWTAAANREAAWGLYAEMTGTERVPTGRRAFALARYFEAWVNLRAEAGAAPASLRSYRAILNTYVRPDDLGRLKLDEIRTRDVDAWLRRIGREPSHRGTPRHPSTIAQARKILSAVMNQAVRDEYAPRNPVKTSTSPAVPRRRMDPLTEAELQALLDATYGTRYEAAYHLAIMTGLRQGELLALTWGDVQAEWGKVRGPHGGRVRLHVHRTLDPRTRVVRNVTKTRRSDREIPLRPEAVAALFRQGERQADERKAAGTAWEDLTPDGGLVFTTRLGRPIRSGQLRRHLALTADRSGVNGSRAARGVTARLRWHDLRHAFAALALGRGVPLTQVSQILGHESIGITADLYGTLTPDVLADALVQATEGLTADRPPERPHFGPIPLVPRDPAGPSAAPAPSLAVSVNRAR